MSEEKNEMPAPCPLCGCALAHAVSGGDWWHPFGGACLFVGMQVKPMNVPAWNRRSPPSPSVGRDEIRREALEEAAKVADGYTESPDRSAVVTAGWIAEDIRSLIGKKPDLGSGFALGGLGETPSDALEAARHYLANADLSDDQLLNLRELDRIRIRAICQALLAASPSPWREMEEDELARAENARGSPASTAPAFAAYAVMTRPDGGDVLALYEDIDPALAYARTFRPMRMVVELTPSVVLHPIEQEGLNAGPPSEASTTPSPPSEGGGK